MYYNYIITTNPKWRKTIGIIQVLIFPILFCTITIWSDLLTEWTSDFFAASSVDSRSYAKRVDSVSANIGFFVMSMSFLYFWLGLYKIISSNGENTVNGQLVDRAFWHVVCSPLRMFNFLLEVGAAGPRRRAKIVAKGGHSHIESVKDYVKGKNEWSDRETSASRYADINSLSMMDDRTKEWLNGKLSWMSREQGFDFIRDLGTKK